MNNMNNDKKAEFKYIACEFCEYPIAVPLQSSSAVCIACPQCGNRSCS